MIKTYSKGFAVLAFLAMLSYSCGGSAVYNNPNFKEKIDWSKQQGIVLPIDVHGFGDGAIAVANQTALFLGILGATLDPATKIPRWVSLQPVILVPPFSQNLSHEMAWNVFHMVDFHKEWDPRKDIHGSPAPIVKLVQALPPAVSAGLAKAEQLIQTQFKKKDFKIAFKPRFLLGAHIDSDGIKEFAGKGINTARVRAFLYDSTTGEYLSYAEWTTAIPWTGTEADKATVVAKMATLGAEILANAIAPIMKQTSGTN